MHTTRRSFPMASAATLALPSLGALAAESTFTITALMDPPEWALLERELLLDPRRPPQINVWPGLLQRLPALPLRINVVIQQ